jgi:hypothetical protein
MFGLQKRWGTEHLIDAGTRCLGNPNEDRVAMLRLPPPFHEEGRAGVFVQLGQRLFKLFVFHPTFLDRFPELTSATETGCPNVSQPLLREAFAACL